MGKCKDRRGQRYGRLLVVQQADNKDGKVCWTCICDCGNVIEVLGGYLQSGDTSSCGCLRSELAGALKRSHGKCTGKPTTEYSVWLNMHERCRNPKNPHYHNYGGRGIFVCERWVDFSNFLSDMGPRPEGTSLDRVDNDQGYSPDNCKWRTRREQARNTRANRSVIYENETLLLCELAERLGIVTNTLFHVWYRSGRPMDVTEMITEYRQKPRRRQ